MVPRICTPGQAQQGRVSGVPRAPEGMQCSERRVRERRDLTCCAECVSKYILCVCVCVDV